MASKYQNPKYINEKHGSLKIIRYIGPWHKESPNRYHEFEVQCDCGAVFFKQCSNVVRYTNMYCQFCRSIVIGRKYDSSIYIGQKYGCLTILEHLNPWCRENNSDYHKFKVQCNCGAVFLKQCDSVINYPVHFCSNCAKGNNYFSFSNIGKVFGSLAVLECLSVHHLDNNTGKPAFRVKCTKCGKVFVKGAQQTLQYTLVGCQFCEKDVLYLDESYIGKQCGSLLILRILKSQDPGNQLETAAYEVKCLICGNVTQKPCDQVINGQVINCGQCSNFTYSLLSYVGKAFNNLKIISFIKPDDIENSTGKPSYRVRCLSCGRVKIIKASDVVTGNIGVCEHCAGYSSGELIISNALLEHDIHFRKEVTFPGLRGLRGGLLRFDFGIYDSKGNLAMLIEFDGVQHFEDNGYHHYLDTDTGQQIDYTYTHDCWKDEYCEQHNIYLLRFSGNITEDNFWAEFCRVLQAILADQFTSKVIEIEFT